MQLETSNFFNQMPKITLNFDFGLLDVGNISSLQAISKLVANSIKNMKIRTSNCNNRASLGNPESTLRFVKHYEKLEALTIFHDKRQCQNGYIACKIFWMDQIKEFL